MTAWQLIGPLPLYTLDAGCTITVEAIDPATGAAVTGVVVSQVTIYGVNNVPDQEQPAEPVALTWVSVANPDEP